VLAGIQGTWPPGLIRGQLGSWHGYPAFTWVPGGDAVPVDVLDAPGPAGLAAHWARLDAFEGPAYLRVWIEVEQPWGLVIASCYEAVPSPHGA